MQRLTKDIGIKWEQVKACSLESAEKEWFEARKMYYSQKKKNYCIMKRISTVILLS